MERPLYWHQGLFLQPQHFQYSEVFLQSLLTPLHRYLQPYWWGVGKLDLPKVISGDVFGKPHQGEFLFPDGTYAVIPDNALMQSRSFKDDWMEEDKPLTVYVGLKKWDPAGENVVVVPRLDDLSSVTSRFVTTEDPEPADDLHSKGPSAEIRRLHYVLKLVWETEKDLFSDYTLIPIARLERSGDEIALSEKFVFPCLSIGASDILLRLVKEVRDQIASRGYQLESYKRERGIHSAEFGARDMVYLLTLRSLNRYISKLYHVTETPRVHPWQVYGILKELIGELSSFSETVNVLGEEDGVRLAPSYDHQDLWKCFMAAQSLATRLLDEITAGPEYVVPLLYDGAFYSSDLHPGMFESGLRYYLVVKTGEELPPIIQSVEKIAKMSSREDLPIRVARALPGIKLAHLPLPPQELPRRSDSLYFEINRHSDLWDHLVKGHNMALYWDEAPKDVQVELMITGRA